MLRCDRRYACQVRNGSDSAVAVTSEELLLILPIPDGIVAALKFEWSGSAEAHR